MPGRPPNSTTPPEKINVDRGFGPDYLFSPVAPVLITSLKPRLTTSTLSDQITVLPDYKIFVDKVLPAPDVLMQPNPEFGCDYFVALHKYTIAPGQWYPEFTPNHKGARIPLRHPRLQIDNWRKMLQGYHEPEIVQFLEYGFPLGLREVPTPQLEPSLRNHGSSYQYFDFIDEFIATGLERCEIAGPFKAPPFDQLHISPLMTAPKKPDSRRAVFDATFGNCSLNNNTPRLTYLENPCVYDYPCVDDFKDLVLKAGKGSYIWKRDLSRFYMQIPLDPSEYHRVCYIWRNHFFFFTSLMFGLTHSGLQGQKVSSAVRWIHQHMGLKTSSGTMYNSLNYSDDIGGCETTKARALESYNALKSLFMILGLVESTAKAHPPSTQMPYLGVSFDTINMTMSIPPEKLEELREELGFWLRKKVASKKMLQSLLGKLFWVSRCVKFSRGFMGRLLGHLRTIHEMPDNKKTKLPQNCKDDIVWWHRYLRRFNGVELIFPDKPGDMSLEALLESDAIVYCGDAQPNGGGAFCLTEYWSRSFPEDLADHPIHIKEFWVIIASTVLWGEKWKGNLVYLFCDNLAVVHVLEKEKPKSEGMLVLLREFLYLVCTRRFTPVFKHVGTVKNEIADFLSRNHGQAEIDQFLERKSINLQTRRQVPDSFFKLSAIW